MNDLDELLIDVAGTADPDALRRVACACCRRILETHRGLFRTFVYPTDGEAKPWTADTLRVAIAAAEVPDGDGASAGRLPPERLAAAAEASYRRWEWANYRLGDHADDTDYEDAFVTWKSTAAVAACCADDIRASIAACLQHAAEAIAFRWDDAEQRAAFAAERAIQADLIRPLVQRGLATLTLTLEDKATGARYVVPGTPCLIGRGVDVDLRLPDRFAARRHAKLTLVDGTWWVADVGSPGGTLVNGMPVGGLGLLHEGDEIQVGSTELVVRLGTVPLQR